MSAKIAAFLITFAIGAAVGTVILFLLIVSMNGYSESDAVYGIIAYLVLSLAAAMLMSAAAAIFVHVFMARGFSTLFSNLIAIPIFSVITIICEAVSAGIGIAVAQFIRVNF